MNAEEDRGVGVTQASSGAASPVRAILEAPDSLNEMSGRIIGCALEAHSHLGPGLLERIYEEALAFELAGAGLSVQRQAPIDISYKGLKIGGQRVDLVVEGTIIVELKAVENVSDTHLAQLVSYLRAARLPLGLLINFNCLRLKDGLFRRMNTLALPHWDHLDERREWAATGSSSPKASE